MSSHHGGAGKSHGHAAPATGLRNPHFRRIFLGLLYLGALSLLVVWELRERIEGLSTTECELREQEKSSLYSHTYSRFLDWASADAAGHVVTLAIPANLVEVQNNLCLGRGYMADVLQSVAKQNPAVVVVDRFYGAGTCASQPESTDNLIKVVRAFKVPVVVGESTNGVETAVESACLVRKPQLDFGSPNVRHGLTRLNTEAERFPLQWLVMSSAPEGGEEHEGIPHEARPSEAPTVERADSLSLAAVKAYDPDFAEQKSIQRLLVNDDHAYANLSVKLPRRTTTQLLCAAGDEATKKRWSLECAADHAAMPNLNGRIVVIGAEVSSDEKVVFGRRVWGFDLQATYIETLLSGDYLRFPSVWGGLSLFAIFIFMIEGLPTILLARRPGWKKTVFVRHAYRNRRYFWVIFWTASLIVVSAFASLALRYLPPLLVYGDILLVATTRLLSFVAESAEDPFLHAHHTSGKAHTMSSTKPAPNTTIVQTSTPTADLTVQSGAAIAVDDLNTGIKTLPTEIEPTSVFVSNNRPGSEGGSEG